MSLHHIAQHMASNGRGPDTELVHMTKGEVAGLQALAEAHGGSLTINPKTGLPEASFLESILPAVIGGATAVFAPWALPWVAGGLGALAWDQSGDPLKGLSTGLSAFGGGSLAGGLTSLGASEAATGIGNAATQAGEEAAQQALAEQAARNTLNANLWDSADALARPEAYSASDLAGIKEAAANSYLPNAAQQAAMTGPGSFNAGLSSALSDPSKMYDVMGGEKGIAKTAAMAAAPLLAGSLSPKQTTPVTPAQSGIGDFQRYSYTPGMASPFPQASPTGVEQSYFPGQSYNKISQADAKALYGYANGGDIQGNDPSDTQGDPNLQNVRSYNPVVRMATGGLSALYRPKIADEEPMKKPAKLSDMPGLESAADLRKTKGLYAEGGISTLGSYSDGGRLLRGPGDGVSDSIPAQIGNNQPARLADGEFVVPARIVSELGNGSTDAGARQLYAMLDRVQKARGKTTGKNRVAKDTNAAKYLPA